MQKPATFTHQVIIGMLAALPFPVDGNLNPPAVNNRSSKSIGKDYKTRLVKRLKTYTTELPSNHAVASFST